MTWRGARRPSVRPQLPNSYSFQAVGGIRIKLAHKVSKVDVYTCWAPGRVTNHISNLRNYLLLDKHNFKSIFLPDRWADLNQGKLLPYHFQKFDHNYIVGRLFVFVCIWLGQKETFECQINQNI